MLYIMLFKKIYNNLSCISCQHLITYLYTIICLLVFYNFDQSLSTYNGRNAITLVVSIIIHGITWNSMSNYTLINYVISFLENFSLIILLIYVSILFMVIIIIYFSQIINSNNNNSNNKRPRGRPRIHKVSNINVKSWYNKKLGKYVTKAYLRNKDKNNTISSISNIDNNSINEKNISSSTSNVNNDISSHKENSISNSVLTNNKELLLVTINSFLFGFYTVINDNKEVLDQLLTEAIGSYSLLDGDLALTIINELVSLLNIYDDIDNVCNITLYQDSSFYRLHEYVICKCVAGSSTLVGIYMDYHKLNYQKENNNYIDYNDIISNSRCFIRNINGFQIKYYIIFESRGQYRYLHLYYSIDNSKLCSFTYIFVQPSLDVPPLYKEKEKDDDD